MRKLYLIIAILCETIVYGQNSYISGSFSRGSDYSGNSYIYFQGTNLAQYNIPITVVSVNEELKESKKWSFTLIAGGGFTIGPNMGWYWQPGEKLIVYFSNGQSIYWTYGWNKQPSFTGRRSCSKVGCRCEGYISEAGLPCPNGTWCKKCKHHVDYHSH